MLQSFRFALSAVRLLLTELILLALIIVCLAIAMNAYLGAIGGAR